MLLSAPTHSPLAAEGFGAVAALRQRWGIATACGLAMTRLSERILRLRASPVAQDDSIFSLRMTADILYFFQQADRMAGHALHGAGKAQALFCGGLHIHPAQVDS